MTSLVQRHVVLLSASVLCSIAKVVYVKLRIHVQQILQYRPDRESHRQRTFYLIATRKTLFSTAIVITLSHLDTLSSIHPLSFPNLANPENISTEMLSSPFQSHIRLSQFPTCSNQSPLLPSQLGTNIFPLGSRCSIIFQQDKDERTRYHSLF